MGAYLRSMIGFWPNARIPYVLDRIKLGENRVRAIESAMEHWQQETPIRFAPHGREVRWLRFAATDQEFSEVEAFAAPLIPSPLPIEVTVRIAAGDGESGVIHEIGHVVGLIHEHQRPDRDRYVTFHADRTEDDVQFGKLSAGDVVMPTGYDFESVMHYPPTGRAIGATQWVDPGWSQLLQVWTEYVLLSEASGQAQLRGTKPNGALGEPLRTYAWDPGWQVLSVLTLSDDAQGFRARLVMWNSRSNRLALHGYRGDGRLEPIVEHPLDGSATHAFATYDGNLNKATLWRYDAASGRLWPRAFGPDGRLESAGSARDVGPNWSSLHHTGDYLLLFERRGRAQIRSAASAYASVAHDYREWSAGWDTFESFRAGGQTCLLRLKSESGDLTIHRMEESGAITDLLDQRSWTSGWTTASVASGKLHLLKRGTGELHVHVINNDGTIGDRTRAVVLKAHDAANQARMGVGGRLSSSDIFAVCDLYPGDVHVHLMQPPGSQGGMVGALSDRADWSSGWTVVEPFRVGSHQRLLVIRGDDGKMRLYGMKGGRLGTILREDDWTSNWKHARFVEAGGRPYLLLLKESNGTMRLHEIDADGMIGRLVTEESWGSGWSSAGIAAVAGLPVVVLYNRHTGELRLRSIAANGRFGEPASKRVHFGYTSVETWTAGDDTFLLLLRADDGRVVTHRIGPGLQLSSPIESRDWTSGWTQAVPFEVNEKPYLFLLKRSDGDVHIHELGSDGRIGALVHDNEASWSSGWDIVRFYSIGFFPFMILVKSEG